MNERIITVVDIGTSKLFGLVGLVRNTDIEIIGAEVIQTEEEWMKFGRIVDIEGVSNGLIELIESLKQQTKERIEWITIGIGGGHIKGRIYSKKMDISPKGREINEIDIQILEKEIKSAVIGENEPEREIIWIVPQEFVIDGITSTKKSPVGMHGNTLEMKFHILTGEGNPIRDLYYCAERSGIKVDKYIYPHSWAVAEAVLTEEEKKMGCIVIDIGRGTTDFVVYSDGKLIFTESLKLGSWYIDYDISLALHTSLKFAEYLKKTYGRCDYSKFIEENKEIKYIEVQSASGKISKKTTEEELSKIIYFRTKEILGDYVKKKIEDYIKNLLQTPIQFPTFTSGIILSGGGAKLRGIKEMAEEIFQLPVRIGVPVKLLNLDKNYQKPEFASGIGLLMLASKTMKEERKNILQKIKGWFRGMF